MGRIVASLWLMLAALWAGPARAAEPWREASSAHFVVYSQDDAATLQRFATRLERFDKALHSLRGMDDAPIGAANRLTVFVVRDAKSVRKLLGDGPKYAAGFYTPRAGGSLAFTPRLAGSGSSFDLNAQIVLLHEYAHHFMMRYFPAAYPAWFVEGFAEFNSTARFEEDGGVSIGLPANHRAIELRLGPSAIPLADLLGGERPALTPAQLDTLYSRGWLLTHYLTFAPARKGQLTRYLDAINHGTPAARAATDAFGPIDRLDRELRGYIDRRMTYMKLSAAEVPIGPVAVRTLTPGEAAILPVAMRSRRGVDETSAKEVAADARAAAAPYPNDPFVQTALAEAEFDTGALEAADAAADRAIAADPKALGALLYRARVVLARAEKADGAARAALVRQGRVFIARANRIDPDDPVPLAMFYATYAMSGEAPTENAILGLTVAHQLAPEDVGLRMTLAHQLIGDRRIDEARALLGPVAFAPHGGEAQQAAQAMLAGGEGGAGGGEAVTLRRGLTI